MQGCSQVVHTITNYLFPNSYRQADLIHLFMMCLVMGFPIKLIGHTAILHGYLNMSAELMRFADHQFFSVCFHIFLQSSFVGFPFRNGGHVPRIPLIIASGIFWYMTGFIHIFIMI